MRQPDLHTMVRANRSLTGSWKTLLAQWQHSTLGDQGRHPNSPQDGQKVLPARPQQATCLREAASAEAGEAKAYSVRYVEPQSAARTKLADFFNILLKEIGPEVKG